MNIYLVERTDSYETGDWVSFVCVAKDEDEAKHLHPNGWRMTELNGGMVVMEDDIPEEDEDDFYDDDFQEAGDGKKFFHDGFWVSQYSDLNVTYIGKADDRYVKAEVIHTKGAEDCD